MWADSISSMTIGPPSGFEANIDRMIREAIDSGDFDDLPGMGEPIPGAGTKDDPHWWGRAWIDRNRVESGVKTSGED